MSDMEPNPGEVLWWWEDGGDLVASAGPVPRGANFVRLTPALNSLFLAAGQEELEQVGEVRLNHEQVRALHRALGEFLAPERQDQPRLAQRDPDDDADVLRQDP